MSIILMLGVNFSATAQEIEFCGEFHKDNQTFEEDGVYLDRFGNRYLPSELMIPNVNTFGSPPENANSVGFSGCSCSDLGINTGIFELWFEDCDLETGIGFDHPTSGQDRRIVVCKVYRDLNELLIPTQTSCNAGNSPIVNVQIIPSHTDEGEYYGNDLSPLGSTILGVGSGISSGSPVRTTLPWRIINLGVELPQMYHSYIRFNFNTNFIWYTGLVGSIQNSFPPEVDLRSVALHEALHTLGFASMLKYGGSSKFDLHLHLTNYPNIGELPVFEYNTTTGFDWDLHNAIIPNDLYSSCQNPSPFGPDIVFRTGVNDVPIFSGASSSNISSFSHLNINCDGNSTPNFVMHPSISQNVERYLTQEEKEILSTMGYRVVGANSDNCEVFAIDDGDDISCSPLFSVPVCESITISVADLLANDLNATGIADIKVENAIAGEITNPVGLPLGVGDSFVFTPNQFGFTKLEYVPIGCNNEIGLPAFVTIFVTFGVECPNPCTEPIGCSDLMGYQFCEVFDDCDFNEVCNIVCNPTFCGTIFSQTAITEGFSSVVNAMNTASFAELPGWQKTHGTPDFSLTPELTNNSGSIRFVSGVDLSEGIFSSLDYESDDYLFSIYFEEQENNDLDNISNFFVVDLIQSISPSGTPQLVNGSNLFSLPTYSGPSETTLVQQEFELHSPGFSRIGSCTNIPEGYDALWIYTEETFINSSENNVNGVFLDGLELIRDEFTAGENKISAQCYDPVSLGEQFCMLSDVKVKYEWKNSAGQVIASYEVLNGVITSSTANVDIATHTITVNPAESTTYTLCRTIVDYGGLPTDFAFCSETDEVAVTVLTEFPDAGFTYVIDEENCKVYFTSNQPLGFHEWDFDNDGITDSDEANPIYCFEGTETILVSHSLSNDCGMDEATQTIQLPDCTPEPPSGCDCPPNSILIPPSVTSLTQALSAGLLQYSFSPQNVIIQSTLTFNTNDPGAAGPFSFQQGSNICMAPGAKIIVPTDGDLTLVETHVRGCNQMWDRIEVRNKAKLHIVRESLIEDGHYAVDLSPGSMLEVNTSTFNRNFVGIHADGDFTLDPFYGNTFDCSSASLLPFFPNQNIDPTTDISFTGLDWNNGLPQFVGVVLNIPYFDEINRNHFRNMRNGIIADNISLNVVNSDFANMTYSPQYPYPLKGYAN